LKQISREERDVTQNDSIHTYAFPKSNNSVTQQLDMKQHIAQTQDDDYKTTN